MKKVISSFISLSLFSWMFISAFAAPASAGAPECFLSNPKTCDTYDHIIESVNASGQICKTRHYSAGSSQSSEGLGCSGPVQEEPVKEVLPTGNTNSPSTVSSPTTTTNNEIPTKIVSNPSVVVSPTITGNNNSVSSSVNNVNTTNNTVVNNTSHSIVNTVNNTSSNVRSEYRTISVNGGYLIIGENGFGKFFPTNNNPEIDDEQKSDELVYLDKADLPVSISKALNRVPDSVVSKRSLRLPLALRNAESVTEDVCTISNRKLSALSKGLCVLEIPIGEGVYEHEIKVVR